MHVIVDMDVCQNHGQCAFAAPDVFEINSEGNLEYVEHPPDDQRVSVEDAVDVCPVQAIRIAS